jgi:hypothetical protein
VAVELFVGVGFVGDVGAVVATGVAAGVAAGVAVPPRSTPPAIPTVPTEPLKAGGVIDRTAPSPVTVPAAINSAFFISVLSRFYLRDI